MFRIESRKSSYIFQYHRTAGLFIAKVSRASRVCHKRTFIAPATSKYTIDSFPRGGAQNRKFPEKFYPSLPLLWHTNRACERTKGADRAGPWKIPCAHEINTEAAAIKEGFRCARLSLSHGARARTIQPGGNRFETFSQLPGWSSFLSLFRAPRISRKREPTIVGLPMRAPRWS